MRLGFQTGETLLNTKKNGFIFLRGVFLIINSFNISLFLSKKEIMPYYRSFEIRVTIKYNINYNFSSLLAVEL